MKLLLKVIPLLLLVPSLQEPTGGSPSPSARHGHGMVYDLERRVTVLFGGRSADDAYLNDTWTWDGLRWRLVGRSGPSPRAWFALAYDVERDVVVLHGGRDATATALSDTWTWDGATWSLASTQGPEARDHHAMAYDPTRKNLVMFGGYDNTTSRSWDDTWAWDGREWTRLASSRPPGARDAHALVYAPRRNELLVFGGMNVHEGETTIWGDTWGWDGARWRLRGADEGTGRSHFAMVFDQRCDCVLRFGGGDPSRTPVGGTWRFDEDSWEELPVTGPSARVDHAMAYDRSRRRTVLFGGYVPGAAGVVFGQTWEWDGERWERR